MMGLRFFSTIYQEVLLMQQQTLHQLLQDLEQEWLRLGYTKGTMTFYRNRWRKLEDFAERNENATRWRMRLLTLWMRTCLTGTTLPISCPGYQAWRYLCKGNRREIQEFQAFSAFTLHSLPLCIGWLMQSFA